MINLKNGIKMDVDNITPDSLRSMINDLCTYLIDNKDYVGSLLSEKFKIDFEMYLELQRQRNI